MALGIGGYAAKGLGALTLFLTAKDAHTYGVMRADVYSQSGDADALAKAYINNNMLAMPSTAARLFKDYNLKKELNGNMRHYSNSMKGYFAGLTTWLAYNVMGIALGATALLAKNKWLWGQGKYLRGGAALAALYFLLTNVIKEGKGVGYTDNINVKF
jgi:hypothetical protein